MATTVEPRDIVSRYLDHVLGGGDHSASAGLVSSPELRQRTTHLCGAFADISVETVELLAEASRVAAHFVVRGTHRGVFQGVPPTGLEFEARCTAIFHVEDGRISQAWMTWDSLSLLEQLGAIARVETVSA